MGVSSNFEIRMIRIGVVKTFGGLLFIRIQRLKEQEMKGKWAVGI